MCLILVTGPLGLPISSLHAHSSLAQPPIAALSILLRLALICIVLRSIRGFYALQSTTYRPISFVYSLGTQVGRMVTTRYLEYNKEHFIR